MKTQTDVAQHTPGPWITDAKSRSGDSEPRHVQVRAFHPGEVTAVKRVATAYYGQTDTEREANARLIAAAPELLTLLRRFYEQTYGLTDLIPALDFEQARAAIAKAEGGAA